jgi:methyl-accepting chemotaxis protein
MTKSKSSFRRCADRTHDSPATQHSVVAAQPGKATMTQINMIEKYAEVLRLNDRDGTLADNCRELWSVIEGRIEGANATYWEVLNAEYLAKRGDGLVLTDELIARSAEVMRKRYTQLESPDWFAGMLDNARGNLGSGEMILAVIAASSIRSRAISGILIERLGDEPERLARLIDTLMALSNVESNMVTYCYERAMTERNELINRERRDQFENDISNTVSRLSDEGGALRSQAAAASQSTRGMLDKTSEVAAAAEQSALAMREAASTAAGLIRAIEDARGEVDKATEVAELAADQAGEASQMSETLSQHAQSIESILGLIRDIAGQTNLLALNATIEAARAGEAGRGFAVVAQEVKSLANQTALATDDIATKIGAIQSATRGAVSANGSVRETVAEVQQSAARIRAAMELQAQTVTMITAAVDETALAADSMSSTIASIRQDTGDVASEIDQLEKGFLDVDSSLGQLRRKSVAFIDAVA